MDHHTAYRNLREKMKRLLLHVNAKTGTTYGACMVDGQPCALTTHDQCSGTWTEGVECQETHAPADPNVAVRASHEMVGRMRKLLERVHAASGNAHVRSCKFEVGGQTYHLDLTADEFEALEGAGKATATAP
jgi:hypothetical protein